MEIQMEMPMKMRKEMERGCKGNKNGLKRNWNWIK